MIGSGETTVDLFVDNLTLSRLGSNFMTDPAEEEVIVDFGVINDTSTVPGRETAVHSGLYDPHCNITAPVISGIENNKTYCDTVEFTVTDNDGIASVKAGNTELTESNGKYTLEKGAGTVTIVATDKAKNETTITVTVTDTQPVQMTATAKHLFTAFIIRIRLWLRQILTISAVNGTKTKTDTGTFVKMTAVPSPKPKHLTPAPMTETAQLRLSANAAIQLLRQMPTTPTANGSQTVMIRTHATAPLMAVTVMKTATATVERQTISTKQFAMNVMRNTVIC